MVQTRREERREATIQEIKDLAWQQMRSTSPGELSLREISRQMRISPAAIFRYFPNRNALLDALCFDAFQSFGNQLEACQAAHASEPVDQQLLNLGLAYRQWAFEHLPEFLLLYGSPVPGFQPNWPAIEGEAQRGLLVLVRVLQNAESNGQITLPASNLPPSLKQNLQNVIERRGYSFRPELLHLAISLWTRVHGLISLELNGQLSLVGNSAGELFLHEISEHIARYPIRKR